MFFSPYIYKTQLHMYIYMITESRQGDVSMINFYSHKLKHIIFWHSCAFYQSERTNVKYISKQTQTYIYICHIKLYISYTYIYIYIYTCLVPKSKRQIVVYKICIFMANISLLPNRLSPVRENVLLIPSYIIILRWLT